ncbi:MAG: hypothetical protein JW793_03925, partial [Acidobacteria bacterium]|nr:hypothetical protein [Acidobacteriota bacterium]
MFPQHPPAILNGREGEGNPGALTETAVDPSYPFSSLSPFLNTVRLLPNNSPLTGVHHAGQNTI